MRRVNKQYINFFIRTFVAILIIGSIYGFYIYISHRTNTAKPSGPSKASVQAKLTEHYLAINSLRSTNITDLAVGQKLGSTRSSIDSTRDAYIKELNDFNKMNINKIVIDNNTLLSQEKNIFASFDQSYSELNKVMIYIPSNDLGTLDPAKNKEVILVGIDASITGLGNAKQRSQTASSSTTANIDQSIGCLKTLRQTVNDQRNEQYQNDLKECDKIYKQVRIGAAKDVLNTLNTKNMDELIATIRGAQQQLR